MDQQALWWNYVSGAARYLHDALSSTQQNRVLLLEEAPYMDYCLQLMQDRFLQRDSSLHIELSDADDWAPEQEIGESLMAQYAPQADYHPMDGLRSEYLASRNLLAGRVLVVRGVERRPEWLPFAVDYAKRSTLRSGLLILTYTGDRPLAQQRKGVEVLKWGSYISSYDMQLFASHCMADQSGLSSSARNYITQIAARLAGTDPILCSELAVEQAAVDIHALLLKLASRYRAAEALNGNHTFVQAVLWEAQLQTVFPIIERARRSFIERYSGELMAVLPQRDEFQKELLAPEDLEFRHMWYYYFKTAGFRSAEEERIFRLMYRARNTLAHLEPLDAQSVQTLFALGDWA